MFIKRPNQSEKCILSKHNLDLKVHLIFGLTNYFLLLQTKGKGCLETEERYILLEKLEVFTFANKKGYELIS